MTDDDHYSMQNRFDFPVKKEEKEKKEKKKISSPLSATSQIT